MPLGARVPSASEAGEGAAAAGQAANTSGAGGPPGVRSISKAELGLHAAEGSCWVSIQGKVYDFTEFLEEHPAGAEAILKSLP